MGLAAIMASKVNITYTCMRVSCPIGTIEPGNAYYYYVSIRGRRTVLALLTLYANFGLALTDVAGFTVLSMRRSPPGPRQTRCSGTSPPGGKWRDGQGYGDGRTSAPAVQSPAKITLHYIHSMGYARRQSSTGTIGVIGLDSVTILVILLSSPQSARRGIRKRGQLQEKESRPPRMSAAGTL